MCDFAPESHCKSQSSLTPPIIQAIKSNYLSYTFYVVQGFTTIFLYLMAGRDACSTRLDNLMLYSLAPN